MTRSMIAAFVLMLATALAAHAETTTWALNNPAGDYADELVRLKVSLKTPYDSRKLIVEEDGKEVPYQVEITEGTAAAVARADIWVCTTIAKGGAHKYEVSTNGNPKAFAPKVTLRESSKLDYELSNGIVAFRVPMNTDGPNMPTPIRSLRLPDGKWVGDGTWHHPSPVSEPGLSGVILGQGPLFAKVRLAYSWNAGGARRATASTTLTLRPGQPLIHIEEAFDMPDGSYWEFDATSGWDARACVIRPNNDGGGPGGTSPGNSFPKDKWPVTLNAGQTRMGDTLLLLLPRWSQAFDDGWLFALHNGTNMIAAIPARAGKWVWPHENKIAVKVKSSGDYAGLRMPTVRGSRYWLLAAGSESLVDSRKNQEALVGPTTMWNLDKVVNEYISEWPGAKGEFRGAFFFGSDTNPTSSRRAMGRAAVANAGKKGDLSTLFWAQINLDPDFYGSYYNYWSPENPNFFTDFNKTSIALVAQLRDHPRFAELRALAEAKFREDIDHSVTLPGGAGQECPGYLGHATTQWAELAPLCREYLGFDPTTWPRYKAAIAFQRHVSYPDGNLRRQNPAGDTHPGHRGPDGDGPQVVDMADENSHTFVTEELPGFGVIFRDRSGTPQETYLSFKSGPNRGHYHGDQLAFHLCFDAHPVAVDHHCSYAPRAGQEHMHNRLAFSITGQPAFEYANMDGYERVIAFKPGQEVDIAVGQVESPRLRSVVKLPPETWDDRWHTHEFDSGHPLIYRRTIVQVKAADAAGADYFVVRDQYWSTEKDLAAHWQLHVLGEKAEHRGAVIRCGKLRSCFTTSLRRS